jgi:hypothetical protein
MDSEMTTMTGCEEWVRTESVFHAMKVVASTSKIGNIWDASVRIKIDLLLKLRFFSILVVIATFTLVHEMT